jgi:uncharacterized membrane protein YqjE
MTDKSDFRAIAALTSDAFAQFSKLVQNDADLAKTELRKKGQEVAVAAGLLVGAAVLVIPAIILALLALSAALIDAGLRNPLAYLVSAAVAAALAALFVVIGMQKLKPEKLAPTETMRQLDRDREAVKGFAQ